MTVQLNDYKLNFENDKTSYSIEEQLPLFIRKDNQDFVAFLKEYYRFLETKITKITVTSDDANSINSIVEDELLSTAHMLMVNDGVDPDIQITGFSLVPYMERCEIFSNNAVENILAVYDPYHQKSVIFYTDTTDDGKSYYVITSLNGTEIVISQPSLFMDGVAKGLSAAFETSTKKIIVSYLDTTLSDHAFVVDCLIGNNGFTVGTPVVLNSDTSSHLKVVNMADNKFAVFYTNEGVEIKNTFEIPQPYMVTVGSGNVVTAFINIEDFSENIRLCVRNVNILKGKLVTITGASGDLASTNGTWTIKYTDELDGGIAIGFDIDESIPDNFYMEGFGEYSIYYEVFRKEMTIGDIDDNENGVFLSERNVFSDKDYQYISPIYDENANKLIVSYLDKINQHTSSVILHIMGYDIMKGKENIINSGPGLEVYSKYISDGKHIVCYQDVTNNQYGTLLVGEIINNKLSYREPFVFNDNATKDIRADYDILNDRIVIIYNSVSTISVGTSEVIDISGEEITKGSSTIFSGYNNSHNDVYYDQVLNKYIILHGCQDLSSGRMGIFNPYQFIFDIVDPGYGMTCNVEIILGEANEGAYGASATGVVDAVTGSVTHIEINHGVGYTEAPPIIDTIVDDLHDIYLGEGTEDNPVIELSDYKSIDGEIIGYIDVDYNEDGEAYRKDVLIEHYAGALERADIDGDYGEVYNPTILNNLSVNASLPKILAIEEIETPIYATNSMHNFQDIDYAFNSKLFLGNDLYSIMYQEIMKEWPAELAPSIENRMKAIVGRNIKDFNRSLGTKDAIKFVIKLIYDRDANVWSAADRLFRLNEGSWYKTNKLTVELDAERDVLSANGRMVYNVSKLIVDSATHDTYNTVSIKTTSPHGLKTGTSITILNDVEYEGTYQITVDDDTTFSYDILYSSVGYRQPLSGIQISNYYGIIEQVEQSTANTEHAILYLTDISGNSFNADEYIKSTLASGEQFECKIVSNIEESEAYADDHNLLNGSVIQNLPPKFEMAADQSQETNEKWDELNTTDAKIAGILVSDVINTDRIQDGDLYQLYSYVVQIQKKPPYILDTFSEDEVKNTIRKLSHPAGFKVTVQEI